MEVPSLISLSESMMESNAISIVSETSKVGLGSLLLFDCNSHDFDLVVSQTDLYLKLVGHNKLVSLN